ncbi:hypothetical protein [Dyadobacter luticola]|uniref:Uncharacterized protein n=1 Tax=Dyadobacter luticola TaxID=1979387 RepID=A0A5R9KXJ6_9BACT|nr:hypothetical protein [Dyadobacter luticola]TLV00829.1 hypothetical protein FEN17_15230 [Dyadobacter luticola]
MKLFRNISDRKSALNWLMLTVLSFGIFLLHETGPANSSFSRESTQIAMGFRENPANVPGIYQFSKTGAYLKRSNDKEFLILNALSKKLGMLVSTGADYTFKLPALPVNSTQHFRSRSLTSEDSFFSFS